MKCCFCGAELEKETRKWFHCVNERCPHKYTSIHETILRELIDGKAAQDALNYVLSQLDAYMNMYLEIRRNPLEFIIMKQYIDNIKHKITSITTQEKE